MNITIQNPIAAGAKAEWSGEADFNQFTAADVRFRNTDLKDMKVTWVPAEILYADGTTASAEK